MGKFKGINFILLLMFLILPSNVNASGTQSHWKQEVSCLATAIYHESRGESLQGQIAVAQVIANRTKSKHYPSSYCKVVYQKAQFTNVRYVKPRYHSRAWSKAMRISINTIQHKLKDPTHGALWYYAHNKIDAPYWIINKRITARIGNHTFLK